MRATLPALTKNLFLKRPTSNVLFVTNRCNLDCLMCFYTEREKRDELTVDEIGRLARSLPPQWYIMFTGGEPFVRGDIADIAAHFYDRGALNLHFSTNATFRSRTLEGVGQIARYASDARVIVVTSIDGPRDVHDEIRAMPGVFDKTVATVRELIRMKRDLPNLGVVANFTFSAFNQLYWRETIDYLRRDLGVDTVNIGLVRGKTKDARAKDVDIERYREAQHYLVATHNRRTYFSPALKRLAVLKEVMQADNIVRIRRHQAPPGYRCLAGRVFNVITETGDVYPCEMLSRKIGNLRDVGMDFMKLWNSDEAGRIRTYIDRRECLCSYECAMGASIAASFGTAARLIDVAMRYRSAAGQERYA
ncbi:MAG: radical SAM protein [Acidobacteriota bacterium]